MLSTQESRVSMLRSWQHPDCMIPAQSKPPFAGVTHATKVQRSLPKGASDPPPQPPPFSALLPPAPLAARSLRRSICTALVVAVTASVGLKGVFGFFPPQPSATRAGPLERTQAPRESCHVLLCSVLFCHILYWAARRGATRLAFVFVCCCRRVPVQFCINRS